jgi:predicted site-specific integrase-resolvase
MCSMYVRIDVARVCRVRVYALSLDRKIAAYRRVSAAAAKANLVRHFEVLTSGPKLATSPPNQTPKY